MRSLPPPPPLSPRGTGGKRRGGRGPGAVGHHVYAQVGPPAIGHTKHPLFITEDLSHVVLSSAGRTQEGSWSELLKCWTSALHVLISQAGWTSELACGDLRARADQASLVCLHASASPLSSPHTISSSSRRACLGLVIIRKQRRHSSDDDSGTTQSSPMEVSSLMVIE